MRSDLAPMSMGDVFDEAFDLYKRNFLLFAGIAAIIHVPVSIALTPFQLSLGEQASVAAPGTPEATAQSMELLGAMMLYLFVTNFFFLIQSGALTLAISDRHLNRPASFGSSYKRLLPNLLRLVVTWFLTSCIMGGLLIAMTIIVAIPVGILSGTQSQEAAAAIGFVFGIGFMVVMGCLLVALGLFMVQIVTVEGGGYVNALSRNWQLVRNRFWPTLGFCLMLVVFTYGLIFTLATSIEAGLDLAVYSWQPVSMMTQRIIRVVLQDTISLFIQPFWMICITLLYYDRRVRREGFDLALMARQVESGQAGEATA